jgi:hypothetical protein
MSLLDMQAMEGTRDRQADDSTRSTLSLLSTDCKDSLVSLAICE